MEEQDEALIERYYLGNLNEAELAEFQRRMAEDEAFWEAANLHADALEAIRLDGIALLRKGLRARGLELDASARRTGRFRLWWMAGVLIALLGLWAAWLWMQPERQPAPSPPAESRDATPPVIKDSTAAVSPPEIQPKPAPPKTDHRRVFAAWFRPYRDPSLEPARRGDAEQSPSDRFLQLYLDGDFSAALLAFDSLGNSAENNDNLLFIKANCLLATGRAAESGTLLDTLIRHGDARFSNQYGWYLALSRLRNNRIGGAESLLRSIASDPGSPRQADAQRLLRELK